MSLHPGRGDDDDETDEEQNGGDGSDPVRQLKLFAQKRGQLQNHPRRCQVDENYAGEAGLAKASP